MPEIVPNVAQIHGLVGHMRTRRMPQPEYASDCAEIVTAVLVLLPQG